jgi:hypothetical protein
MVLRVGVSTARDSDPRSAVTRLALTASIADLSARQSAPMSLGGVGEVTLVGVALQAVEPPGHPSDIEAGTKDSVLDVSCELAELVPLLFADRPGLSVAQHGLDDTGKSFSFCGDSALPGPDLAGELKPGERRDEEAEQVLDDGGVGDESGEGSEGGPRDGRGEDPVAVCAAKAGVPSKVLLKGDQHIVGMMHAVGGVVPAVGDPLIRFPPFLILRASRDTSWPAIGSPATARRHGRSKRAVSSCSWRTAPTRAESGRWPEAPVGRRCMLATKG